MHNKQTQMHRKWTPPTPNPPGPASSKRINNKFGLAHHLKNKNRGLECSWPIIGSNVAATKSNTAALCEWSWRFAITQPHDCTLGASVYYYLFAVCSVWSGAKFCPVCVVVGNSFANMTGGQCVSEQTRTHFVGGLGGAGGAWLFIRAYRARDAGNQVLSAFSQLIGSPVLRHPQGLMQKAAAHNASCKSFGKMCVKGVWPKTGMGFVGRLR